ncbi:MAG: SUF system NifU family Fe-S cluster assembly protein [Gemmatimonadales bacterium]|nr:SUF system NifU family Fe-S cluster assembly protein [Gemmatimonadales bacterium]
MADLRELYQQIVLDHNRRPRNFREIPDATRTAEGTNPLCGDQITLYVTVDGDVISDVAFQGSGCAISQASASLMTSAVKGMRKEEAESLFRAFHAMVTCGPGNEPDTRALGKLAALAGVRQFPARVKCANLAWHTLHEALHGSGDPVSTE